jgi:hypothetical protein
MKYSENTIPKTQGELLDAMIFTLAHAENLAFPEWTGLDFDGAFQRLFRGVENLRKRFGDAKADKVLDMLQQAKSHFEQGPVDEQHKFWGSWLMQDIAEVIKDKAPFAYPPELWRWG